MIVLICDADMIRLKIVGAMMKGERVYEYLYKSF